MIAVGDSYRYNLEADFLYHCDAHWWNHYMGVPEFKGKKISLEPTEHTLNLQQSEKLEGLDLTPGTIVTGRNSGYQAINLAVQFKPKKIILSGYDMKKTNDQYNIIGDHPKEVKRGFQFSGFIKKYRTLPKELEKLNIQVYNCTRDSDLDCFPRRTLTDVI